MFEAKKNEKAFKELADYAKKTSLPLKQVLLSDEHLDNVAAIFYKNMPKLVRMAMKEQKFKEFYKANREQFTGQMPV